MSLFYGHNQSYYYLTQALPILCTTSLPFVLHGAYSVARAGSSACKRLLYLSVWTLSIYSLAGHKEWRFVHPLLPIFHVFAAKSLVDGSTGSPANPTHLPVSISRLLILLLSIPASVYAVSFHSRAQLAVMDHIRTIPLSEFRSLGFLMPCHSTPWQAYLHRKELEGRMWALGCEPPLK